MELNEFEKWLWTKFEKTDGQGMSKDGMVDAFDGWIENLEIDDWLKFGQEYKEAK